MGQPSGSYSFSFTIDQNLIALVFLVALALASVVIAAWGVIMVIAPGSRLARRGRPYLLRELSAWGAGSAMSDPAEMEALLRQLTQLNGWSVIGGGLGAIGGVGAIALLALGVTGSLSDVMGDWQLVIFALFFQSFGFGMTSGYLTGSHLVTRRAAGPTWAELRRRRVRDYRAGWLGWGPFALAGLALAPLVVAALGQTHLAALIGVGRQSWPAIPILATMVACALLIPTLAALSCRWIVTSPRALTVSDPQMARAADEMRRATSIGLVMSYTWISSGWTLMGMAAVATQRMAHFTGITPASATSGLLTLLGLLAYFFGIGLSQLRGRLGGRVTGGRVSPGAMLAGLTSS